MAKGLRSKVKRAYRALKREKMGPIYKKRLNKTVSALHLKVGLEQKQSMEDDKTEKVVTHSGVVLSTNFVPDHPRPKLNVVHGPNAVKVDHDQGKVVDLVPKTSMVEDADTENATEKEAEPDMVDDDAVMTSVGNRNVRKKVRKNSVVRKARTKKSQRHVQNRSRRAAITMKKK